jgi:SAM-dependent methyltransferase
MSSAAAVAMRPVDRSQPSQSRCPCCGSDGMKLIHSLDGVPTNSCILLPTRAEALSYPRGQIRLEFCTKCGFLSNTAFETKLTEYSARYEETQAYSPTFNAFHDKLARSLVERHGLRGKDVLEIGCGKGEFLNLLCELGGNRGLGFDPGYSEARGKALGDAHFEVVRDFFSERYAHHQADFVACKMTLEHIPAPREFLHATIRTARNPSGIVFIQVPESLRIVKDCAFEDIYYEHCSYFSAGSLARLFRGLGLEILSVDVAYDNQYLTVEAVHPGAAPRTQPNTDDLAELARYADSFPDRVRRKIEGWSERLAKWRAAGKRVAIWGSGSKGVSFLGSVPNADHVSYAVDINPYRSGHFMPASGHEIVAPARLKEIKPDVVIVMNAVYVPEIKRNLAELGLSPEVDALQ